MYFSLNQIERSLNRLGDIHPFFGMSFLAFKRAGIPIGATAPFIFTNIANDILERHYKASSEYDGFYNPFITSDKSARWLRPRYGSTSLQRITTDTFGDALIHTKKSSDWGWQGDYIQLLKQHLGENLIPAFDLAVWLYRFKEWPTGTVPEVVNKYFFDDYHLNDQEIGSLFDRSTNVDDNWLTTTAVSEDELVELIGAPPGSKPAEGAAVRLLEFHYVGPTELLRYEPAERLNIITGDNSLGKTFILECLWWVVTGEWFDKLILPKEETQKHQPKIISSIAPRRGRELTFTSKYDWDQQAWKNPIKREAIPGLVIYARYDGSFSVWDPTKLPVTDSTEKLPTTSLFFSRDNIWDGLTTKDSLGKTEWLCNGLITDWVKWQTSDRFQDSYGSLVACLEALSPSGVEALIPGPPKRLPRDTREFPTLKMPYGDIPVTHASAGVQRIIALAYILVWSWQEHLARSALNRREPQRRLILIVDEIEAHLHPRWQRLIVPALISVVEQLSSWVTPQIHLATHSPLVMASAETVFNEATDDLHHLVLADRKVALEELPFVKRGKVDLWLMSDVFGLNQARSLPAEKAIEDAKNLQLSADPSPEDVMELNGRLTHVLAPDDEFWVRWRFFAKQRGVLK